MKVGIAAPASLHILASCIEDPNLLPRGYEFPQTAYIVKELLRNGHTVDLFTLDQTVRAPEAFRGEQLTIHVGRYRHRHRARDFFKVERTDLLSAMKQSNCEIIHAHWTYEFAIAALATGRPCVITLHDWAPTILRLMPHPYRFIRFLMNFYTLRRASNFTVTSPYLQNRLRRATDRQAPIIPNGLLDEMFSNDERQPNHSAPILISVNHGFGRLKNVRTLLEAFPMIRGSHKGAELWLAGDGFETGGPAQFWAHERGLEDGVKFLGPTEHSELLQLIRQADVLVHPSREESFGMILIEAMSQGTPVVGGKRSGAVPWVLGGGRAGVLVDITASEAIGEGVLGLLDDKKVWEELSRAGHRYAYEHFRLSQVVAHYLREYESVLASRVRTH